MSIQEPRKARRARLNEHEPHDTRSPGVPRLAEYPQRLHRHPELLAPFAAQRRLGRLSAADLAAGELPHAGKVVRTGAPGDHDPPRAPDNAGDNKKFPASHGMAR